MYSLCDLTLKGTDRIVLFTKEVSLAGTLLFPDLFLLTYFTIFFYLRGAPYWWLGSSPYLLHPPLAQQPSFTTFLNLLLLLPGCFIFNNLYALYSHSVLCACPVHLKLESLS